MIKIKRVIATAALTMFAFSSVGCSLIEKTPEAIAKTVLAKVNGEKITRAEVDEIADPYLKSYYGEDYDTNEEVAEYVKELRIQAINLLVEEKIMYLKAEELGLLPSDEEVETETTTYIEGLKESLGGEEAFNTALENAQLTLDEYTAQLKENIKSNLIVTNVTNEIFKDITVTDDEIKTYYDEHLDSYKTATVSHILVEDEATAKEVREKAVNGEDFATLAKEYSKDTGTAENGGSLGTVTYDTTDYVQEFTDAFKALREGEISEPIKSNYGYHIIKVTNIKQQTLEEATESIRSTIKQNKESEIYNTSIEEWKKEYKVKTYENRL
ncbi:MAG: peptidylprolyl isomerase [Clostridium sp.]|nr:peptidylprolyl isomerase [Clostridium sp.]